MLYMSQTDDIDPTRSFVGVKMFEKSMTNFLVNVIKAASLY